MSQEVYLSRQNQGNQNQMSGPGLGGGWGGWVKGGWFLGVEYGVEGGKKGRGWNQSPEIDEMVSFLDPEIAEKH